MLIIILTSKIYIIIVIVNDMEKLIFLKIKIISRVALVSQNQQMQV